jgi:glycine dehydrogenase
MQEYSMSDSSNYEQIVPTIADDRVESSSWATPSADWRSQDEFLWRHIGPQPEDIAKMLEFLGFASLEDLIEKTVPSQIRQKEGLSLIKARTESQVLHSLKAIASKNQVFRSFIGMGYHSCITPPVIQRNILENPGWYTQYTPYQPEISQGRLEALLNFQTMVIDLTGMEIANSSLLDEGTAAAEAMTMAYNAQGKNPVQNFWVSQDCHPQTIAVVETRAKYLGVKVIIGNYQSFDFSEPVFGVLLQYPATDGAIYDYQEFVEKAHEHKALAIAAADLLSLTLLKPPGEWGADVVVGNTQRFGVPLGYGGPHAAYFATKETYKRQIPGRIVGVSKDKRGEVALRLALQTREQHIRRDKATSNICTAQVLLAVIASMYAVYHGASGLRRIAQRIHGWTVVLATGLDKLGYEVSQAAFFDTITVKVPGGVKKIVAQAAAHSMDLRTIDEQTIGISLDETTTKMDVIDLLEIFAPDGKAPEAIAENVDITAKIQGFERQSKYLTHPVFNTHHSETELLRYMQRLQNKDLSLTHSMIPLGSCTMKLNATAEMIPVTWAEFGQIHPFHSNEPKAIKCCSSS